MAARTLTAAEVLLVQRFARRTQIWLWILLPLVALVALGLPAFGIVMWRDSDERLLPVGFCLLGPGIAFLFHLQWSSTTTYSKVDTTTTLVAMSGVLHLKRIGTKTFTLAIDDVAVQFVHPDVRRAVAEDEPCVVEVLSGAPPLVITARPGQRIRWAKPQKKPRKPKRRPKR
ncbi:MAG: hypothetical protein H0T89_00525 [Deltaproteobacteria bacterium]|nr:hypothetical protein [Deltaproteobacteria bacterium]MDQ3300373.1 hypothetical protein [Myxococcota bacterium]